VQFGFQFETLEQQAADDASAAKATEQAAAPAARPAAVPSKADALPAPAESAHETPRPETGGGEVVRLDRFRKK
jgi:hypothetical protein